MWRNDHNCLARSTRSGELSKLSKRLCVEQSSSMKIVTNHVGRSFACFWKCIRFGTQHLYWEKNLLLRRIWGGGKLYKKMSKQLKICGLHINTLGANCSLTICLREEVKANREYQITITDYFQSLAKKTTIFYSLYVSCCAFVVGVKWAGDLSHQIVLCHKSKAKVVKICRLLIFEQGWRPFPPNHLKSKAKAVKICYLLSWSYRNWLCSVTSLKFVMMNL